jgi:tetratricopeptide (TPR) repeat protein
MVSKMKNRQLLVVMASAFFAFAAPNAKSEIPGCTELFEDAVSHFNQGEYLQARALLEEAVSIAPYSLPGPDPYIPFIYLAATYFELGDTNRARESLTQSQIYDLAKYYPKGEALIEQYAAAISAAPVQETGSEVLPRQTPAPRVAGTLSVSEADVLRARVLRRCGLQADMAQNKLPWYFHYLLGLEYSRAGDPGRALDSLLLGANLLQTPRFNKRMYGMHFMDYLPYYRIALTYVELQEWERADVALRTSREMGEFSPGQDNWNEFDELRTMVSAQLNSSES